MLYTEEQLKNMSNEELRCINQGLSFNKDRINATTRIGPEEYKGIDTWFVQINEDALVKQYIKFKNLNKNERKRKLSIHKNIIKNKIRSVSSTINRILPEFDILSTHFKALVGFCITSKSKIQYQDFENLIKENEHIVDVLQIAPLHFHINRVKDKINSKTILGNYFACMPCNWVAGDDAQEAGSSAPGEFCYAPDGSSFGMSGGICDCSGVCHEQFMGLYLNEWDSSCLDSTGQLIGECIDGTSYSGFAGDGVKVAVIDSGIDWKHEAFHGPTTTDEFEPYCNGCYPPEDGCVVLSDNNCYTVLNEYCGPACLQPALPFPTDKIIGGYDFTAVETEEGVPWWSVDDCYQHGTDQHTCEDVLGPPCSWKQSLFGNYCVGNPNDPMDRDGHGTHVAGTIAGDGLKTYSLYEGTYPNTQINYYSAKGIAPKVSLYAYKVGYIADSLEVNEIGHYNSSVCNDCWLRALETSMDTNNNCGNWEDDLNDSCFTDHVDIVNLSLGGGCGYTFEDIGRDVYANLRDLGVTVITSAGNSGPLDNSISCPALYPEVISVGSSALSQYHASGLTCTWETGVTDWVEDDLYTMYAMGCGPLSTSEGVSWFSSRGPGGYSMWTGNNLYYGEDKPNLVAPGEDILAPRSSLEPSHLSHDDWNHNVDCMKADPPWNFTWKGGTSMAGPVVSGVAAIIKQMYPDFTPQQIKDYLMDTAKPLTDEWMDYTSFSINASEFTFNGAHEGVGPDGDFFPNDVYAQGAGLVQAPTLGDVNFDGMINVVDLVTILDVILGVYQFSEAEQFIADYNQDGFININDIINIIQNEMGLSPQQQSAIMNEIKRLSRNKTQQTPIRPGDSVRDIEPG